ncbi:DNA-protecting protein DprA [Arthrobacter gandavensis]|uniref:DNA-processing protein DprA n=1 Tax=Arthrobacter gandavensis TaxID=169960 RepID=UPI00188DD94E|nr:DNA-processing protein DprA [Arthrobacter gandavensis]MBF4995473.1 DNA-protecting protein DprA [Arthrobacter gandavensis]
MSRVEPVLLARAALSRLIEPSDTMGQALVAAAGPETAALVASGRQRAGSTLRREMGALLEERGVRGADRVFAEALGRWLPRAADLAPQRDLQTVRRFGGRMIVPEDTDWPAALDDLGQSRPFCLWTRGNGTIPELAQCLSLVGSRDATSYGLAVTGDLAAGLVQRGRTVISGGAYGIDAQAHRSALSVGGIRPGSDKRAAPDGARPSAAGSTETPTLAVLAGGVDRLYPAGNEDLLRAAAETGLIVSEVPPGSAPTRWRFLQRNRLIAALAAATVVVEARWRSGALNTAHHAAELGRGVGAVPGSVYSANSAGCHRLLREGSAVCVSDAAEVLELIDPFVLATDNAGPDRAGAAADHDGLAVEDILLLDALPLRKGVPPQKLSAVAGLSPAAVRAGLARLELSGLARRTGEGLWQRGDRSPAHPRPTKPPSQGD